MFGLLLLISQDSKQNYCIFRSGAVAQWRSGAVAQWRSGAVAQWRSDYSFGISTKRTRVRILVYRRVLRCQTLGKMFTPHSSSSLNCVNEFLAIDNGNIDNGNSFRAFIASWLDVSLRRRFLLQLNKSARE